MKNRKVIYISLSLFALVLTSCKEDLQDVFNRGQFNSPIFSENYYSNWADDLKEYKGKPPSSEKESFYRDEDDNPILNSGYSTYNEFLSIVKVSHSDVETSPLVYLSNISHSMINSSKDFSYGYSSKLFDGVGWCMGKQQLSRIQTQRKIGDDVGGFAFMFPREIQSLDYIALSLKGASMIRNEPNGSGRTVRVNINFDFFKQTSSGYEVNRYSFKKVDLHTNAGDVYNMVGFLANGEDNQYKLKTATGFALTYEVINDINIDQDGYQFALFAYELYMPNSVWK